MTTFTVHEQDTNDDDELRFTNDDPNLAEVFPEELVGWHGCVYITLKLESNETQESP